jgi:hypothetical protein
MQQIPPTKISLKDFTPLYPSSAYTVATTWLPKPSIVTTLTEVQTWSVKSSINHVSMDPSTRKERDEGEGGGSMGWGEVRFVDSVC